MLTGEYIPSTDASFTIIPGKISKTKTPTPTISHASAYRSSNAFFLIILMIMPRANNMATAIIICNFTFNSISPFADAFFQSKLPASLSPYSI